MQKMPWKRCVSQKSSLHHKKEREHSRFLSSHDILKMCAVEHGTGKNEEREEIWDYLIRSTVIFVEKRLGY